MSESSNCGNCFYWKELHSDLGDCRFNPPQIIYNTKDNGSNSLWPTTQREDFCGQWKRANDSNAGIVESIKSIDDPIVNTLIRDMRLTTRTERCLTNEFGQDVTVADVMRLSYMELYAIPNFGKKSLKEVETFISSLLGREFSFYRPGRW